MNLRDVAAGALWVLATGAVGAAWTALAMTTSLVDVAAGQVVFFTLAALAAPAIATAMLRRHPFESTGILLAATILASMLGVCRTTPLGVITPIAGTTALVFPLLPLLVVVRSAALQSSAASVRMITVCFWLTAAMGVAVAAGLLWNGAVPGPLWWTGHPGQAGSVVIVLLAIQTAVVIVALIVTVVGHVRRRIPLGGRLALRPIVIPALCWAAAAAAGAAWTLTQTIQNPINADIEGDASTTFLVLPTVLIGVLAAGLGWVDLVVRRTTGRGFHQQAPQRVWSPSTVEQYLVRALADSSIRVLYPIDVTEGPARHTAFVSGAGHPAAPSFDDPERAVTEIRRGSALVGVIEHDVAGLARPEAVELVATGAGLMMETERLTATSSNDLEQSRLLAERLLSASDGPRDALRSHLLSGPLADLDAISDDLVAGQKLSEVCDRLSVVTAQVRELSHGLFPAALSGGGLRAVLGADRAPTRRYSAVTEMTAYLAAHDDPSARIIDASLPDGPGVRIVTRNAPSAELLDRLTALGGQITEEEPPRPANVWAITVPDSSV